VSQTTQARREPGQSVSVGSATTDTSADTTASSRRAEVRAILMAALRELSDDSKAADGWPAAERKATLGDVDQAMSVLTVVRGSVLVAERDAGTWNTGDGDRSFGAWRGRQSRGGAHKGAAEVRQAEQLDTVPDVTEAVTKGLITVEHAAIIAKIAATGTPAQQAAAKSAAGQEELLNHAKTEDVATFDTTAAAWAAAQDPLALQRARDNQHANRWLSVKEVTEGTRISGLIDTDAGRRLTGALEAVTPRPPKGAKRTYGQRNADALDTMAATILASADSKPGASVPPQISMIVTAETWEAAKAARDRRRERALSPLGLPLDDSDDSDDGGSGCVDTGPAPFWYPPATYEDGTPVPDSELAIAMCDCAITRIVLDADNAVINLGRRKRCYTGAQRTAVIARDRHCAWPDCQANARWCQIHHITWWERGGETSLDVGVLLCNFHHHEVHRQDLIITRTNTPPGGDSLALCTYTFTDRHGRTIGQPPGTPPTRPTRPTRPGTAPPGSPAPRSAPPGSAPPGSAPPGSAPPGSARPGHARPGGRAADERPDVLFA
jgi:hypothetical protein